MSAGLEGFETELVDGDLGVAASLWLHQSPGVSGCQPADLLLVTIVPDSPSQWKPGFRPGLTWGFSLLPPPLSSLSLGYRNTSSEEDGVQAPGNREPNHRALCPGSRVTLKSLPQRMGCGSHPPLPWGAS